MEVSRHTKHGTPLKDPKSRKNSKLSENSNPNTSDLSSPLIKSTKSQTYYSKNPVFQSPRNKLRERKFVVVGKKKLKKEISDFDCKCKEKIGGNSKKCLCVAYENLRASQEEFFKKKAEIEVQEEVVEEKKGDLIDNQGMKSAAGSGKVMSLVMTPDSKELEEEEEEKNDINLKNPLKRALHGLKQAEDESTQ